MFDSLPVFLFPFPLSWCACRFFGQDCRPISRKVRDFLSALIRHRSPPRSGYELPGTKRLSRHESIFILPDNSVLFFNSQKRSAAQVDMVVGVNSAACRNITPGAEFNGTGAVQQGKTADQDIGFPIRVGKHFRMQDQFSFMHMPVRMPYCLVKGKIELGFCESGWDQGIKV